MFEVVDNVEQLNFYPAGINKVAVCLYGCYRTGDFTLPYIKKWFESDTVDVDFFCSIKEYEDFSNANGYDAAEELIDEIHDKLNILNPKRINTISKSDDENIYHKTQQRGVYSVVDSIMQKQIYEMETGIEYDIVFVLRYDMLFGCGDISLVDKVVEHANAIRFGSAIPTTMPVMYEANNRWIATWPYMFMTRRVLFNATMHDCSFYGSNQAINALAYYYSQHIISKDTPLTSTSWAMGVDLHHLMHYVFKHADITQISACKQTRGFKIIRPNETYLDPYQPETLFK